jgi:SPP1 family predicted phage head-tail adaptor
MSVIAAGSLRHRITFRAANDTKDSLGAPGQEWTTFARVWGNIEPISARDFIAAQRLSNDITHLITIRASSTFQDGLQTARLQAVLGGRVFRIHGALNVEEANVCLLLYASEHGIDNN